MMYKIFSEDNGRITKNLWLFFSIIVVINIFYKINYLGFSSFWYDEIVSIESAWQDFGHIKHVSEWDNNPPFYYYCLSVWIKLFGDSEFSARFLSVLFSAFSGGVVFLIANKFFNKTTAIIASFLFLSSNFLFFYSHETRAYSLVCLLVLISSFLFLNFRTNNDWKNIFLIGLLNFLVIYTHYIAGIVLLLQSILMFFYFNKSQVIKFSYSNIIVLSLIFIRFTKKQFLLIFNFNNPDSKFWLKKSEFSYLKEVISEFLFDSIFVIPLLILIIIAFVFTFKFKVKESYFATVYSTLIGLGSIIILFIVGIKVSVFLDRYLIFAVPFIIILIANGLSFIKMNYFGIIVSVLFFIFSSFKIDYKTQKPMDFKNAVNFIKYIKTDTDLIIIKNSAIPSLFCYYYEKDYFRYKKKNFVNASNIYICSSENDTNFESRNFKRVIVFNAFEDLNTKNSEIDSKILSDKKHSISLKKFKGVTITFYQ